MQKHLLSKGLKLVNVLLYLQPVTFGCAFPVDTRRRFNVYKTSTRRRRRRVDVLQTLKQRRVSTGLGLKKSMCVWSYMLKRILKKFSFINISIQRACGTLKQNLVKIRYIQVINLEVKPSRSHQMTQQMQMSDFLVNKFKSHVKFSRSS